MNQLIAELDGFAEDLSRDGAAGVEIVASASQQLARLERENAALRRDVYQCPPTSENSYEGFKWRDACEELERENAALREQVEELDAKWKMAEDQCFDQVGKIGELERENAALRHRCEELEAERTQFANRATRLAAVEHELEESRKAERLSRVQLQAEREARK